jgi:hypothetical protein
MVVKLKVLFLLKGKWSKERERTKSGRWRKKRSDAGKRRREITDQKGANVVR